LAVVLDTSATVALIHRDDPHHVAAAAFFAAVDDDLITTPLAVAEMDYFAFRLGGPAAAMLLWRDFQSGALGVRWWADAMDETLAIALAHPPIGLTDASLVALAGRLRTNRIATFDHRHFRALTTPAGRPFTVLPADAP
jgi:uncharacterized protein